MTAITACFWIKTNETEDGDFEDTYISYAVQDEDNEFIIFNKGTDLILWMHETSEIKR